MMIFHQKIIETAIAMNENGHNIEKCFKLF